MLSTDQFPQSWGLGGERSVTGLPTETWQLLHTPTREGERHITCKLLLMKARNCGYGREALEMLGETFCQLNTFPRKEMLDLVTWLTK